MKNPASLPEKPVTGFLSLSSRSRTGRESRPLPFRRGFLASLLLFTVLSPASAAVIGDEFTPVIDNSQAIDSADTAIEAGNNNDPPANVSVTNSGNLTISGDNRLGIIARSEGSGPVSINNSGHITTTGENSYGLEIYGKSGHVSVTNSGNLTTSGLDSKGLYIESESDVTVKNTGNIDSRSSGIEASTLSGKLSIDNKGRINTDDDNNHGIAALNDGDRGGQNRVTVTNSGDITTRGDYAFGVAASITQQTDGDNRVSLTNEGNVLTYGDGSYALFAGNMFGDLQVENRGNLKATGDKEGGGIGTVTATGDVLVVNSGNIAAAGTQAQAHHGIYSYIKTSGNLAIVNSGAIVSEGTNSYGIRAENEGSGDIRILQTGTLSVQGEKQPGPDDFSAGIYASVQNSGNLTIANSGTMAVTSKDVNSYGIWAKNWGSGDIRIVQTGTLSVQGKGQNQLNDGIFASARNGSILFENSGNISTLDTTDAVSLFTRYGKLTFTNSGTITARGDRNGGVMADMSHSPSFSFLTNTGLIETHGIQAPAVYLYVKGTSQAVFVNRGDIRTFGDSDRSNTHGSAGLVISSKGRLAIFNSGSIVTRGLESDGINLSLYEESITDIASTVPVQVTGRDSYPLYAIISPPFTTGSLNLKTWALIPGLRQAEFGVDGGPLTFDNTHLILYPGDTANGFVWDKVHPVRDMVDLGARYQLGSTATGRIASVSSVMPMLTAHLSGDSWDNQSIWLSLDTSRSYGQQANVAAVRNMQNRMWLTNRTLSSALANAYASPDDNSVFAQSYYLNAGSSGDVSSSSDSVGFVFGGTKRIYPDFLLGFHAGYEHTDMQADSAGLKGDSDSWLLGLHGAYYVAPSAFVRAQLTGSVSRSAYDFAMTGDASSDKRTEYAVFANVTGGYDFQVNDANTITPEVGLAYLYMKNPSMDANWSDAGNRYMDVQVESESYQAAFATAALRWTGAFTQQSTSVKPTVALGARQTLTDGEIDGGMRFVGNRYGSYVTDDKTVGTVEAGLQFQQRNMTMAVKYNGSFGSDTHDNVVWGEIGFAF